MKELILVRPRGFCAGVVRAIDTVDIALQSYGTPLYVRREIVHNQSVVEGFKKRGVIFIDTLEEAPEGSLVIFSAHGVSPQVRKDAEQRKLKIIDATCPLVTKVHSEVHKYKRMGFSIVLIGHEDHDEVEGTLGEAPELIQVVGTPEDVEGLKIPDPNKVVALTQTTLSVDECKTMIDALRKKFPNLTTPPKDDICYATQNRQDAVKALVGAGIDLLLVVGSRNSSNSQRLREVAQTLGVDSYLIDQASEIMPEWINGKKKIGLTAGASAPEYLVQDVVESLKKRGFQDVELDFIPEDVSFALPAELANLNKTEQGRQSHRSAPLPMSPK